jgi:hypothetical protein
MLSLPLVCNEGFMVFKSELEDTIIALQTQNNLPLVANEGEKETPTS